jgi:hypothetical protein
MITAYIDGRPFAMPNSWILLFDISTTLNKTIEHFYSVMLAISVAGKLFVHYGPR